MKKMPKPMRPLLVFLGAVLATTACNSVLESTVTNDRTVPLLELQSRRNQWNDKNISNYDFDYDRDCACTAFATQPVRIEVRNDAIVRVVDTLGNPLVLSAATPWPTMDSLFVWAHAELSDMARGVQVLFDSTNHYPIRLRSFTLASQSELVDHIVTNWAQVP